MSLIVPGLFTWRSHAVDISLLATKELLGHELLGQACITVQIQNTVAEKGCERRLYA
jgi:hypothetical protein